MLIGHSDKFFFRPGMTVGELTKFRQKLKTFFGKKDQIEMALRAFSWIQPLRRVLSHAFFKQIFKK